MTTPATSPSDPVSFSARHSCIPEDHISLTAGGHLPKSPTSPRNGANLGTGSPDPSKQNRAKRRTQRLLRQNSHGQIADAVVNELKDIARRRSSQNPVDEQALIDEALGAGLATPEPDPPPSGPPSPLQLRKREKRRRSSADSGLFSSQNSFASLYDEGGESLAEIYASEVTTVTVCMAARACQELELYGAAPGAQNKYIAVDASLPDAGVPVDADQEGYLEFDGDDEGAINSAGRAAQTRASADLGVPVLGLPADSRLAARRSSKLPADDVDINNDTEVEPIYDSASFLHVHPTPDTPDTSDTSAVARVIVKAAAADSGASGDEADCRLQLDDRGSGDDGADSGYEYHEVKLVRAAPHAPRVAIPVDDDAVYGLFGQLEQLYDTPHANHAKQPCEPPRAADDPYSLPEGTDASLPGDGGTYARLRNGSSVGNDRRSLAGVDYENAYDLLGDDTASKSECPYMGLEPESLSRKGRLINQPLFYEQ